ncbi:unnamed protein product [Rotaria socialis]|uniref:Uncharacterized protein n=2 Tax=Rotaria socialis TaxID=392032 RepID=A0A817VRF5_9BILA|nr:unnamed protein product [Rotaria socialis]
MNTEEIQMNSLSKSDEENREFYSPWSRFHPLIFIPGWIAVFVSWVALFKALMYFINTTNGSAQVWGYVMLVMVIIGMLSLILPLVKYLLDMKMIYFNSNKSSNSTDEQSEKLSLLFLIKSYLQKCNHFYFFKVKNEYKQNGNIISVDNVV